jgi:hypothetical protein
LVLQPNAICFALLWFPAMEKVAIAGLGVTYIRSTGEHATATIGLKGLLFHTG